jgi:quercetin dioxygenase-like cupin family protein
VKKINKRLTVYPIFMRNGANAIKEDMQSPGIEGFVYDGADGSQMIHWTCKVGGVSKEHTHDYDEYMLVVQGRYTMIINGKKILVTPGDEFFIPKGMAHAGEFIPGTRTIHAFGGLRAKRKK